MLELIKDFIKNKTCDLSEIEYEELLKDLIFEFQNELKEIENNKNLNNEKI